MQGSLKACCARPSGEYDLFQPAKIRALSLPWEGGERGHPALFSRAGAAGISLSGSIQEATKFISIIL